MKYLRLTLFLLLLTPALHAMDLPGNHVLTQNEQGEYYVINNEKVVMVEPAIIKLGFNSRWILACIKNEAIDSELIRWVFIDMRNGGTYDSLNADQWLFYRDEAYTDLQKISLTDYRDEDCP